MRCPTSGIEARVMESKSTSQSARLKHISEALQNEERIEMDSTHIIARSADSITSAERRPLHTSTMYAELHPGGVYYYFLSKPEPKQLRLPFTAPNQNQVKVNRIKYGLP